MFAIVGTQSAPSAEKKVERQVWDALADRIYSTALIQTPSPTFIGELKEALRSTPPSTQQRWLETLRRRIVNDPSKNACADCLCESLINLTVDPDGGGKCSTCSAATESPLDLLANAELLALGRQQTRGLGKGDDCQVLLEESFSRLCDVSNRIVLVDRFAVADAVRADAKTPQGSGFQKILRLADSHGVGLIQLHIAEGFAVNGDVVQAGDIPALVLALVKPLNLANVGLEVVVQTKHVGVREFHDRSIAFVWSSVGGVSFALGKGMSQFDGIAVSQDHDLLRKSHEKVISLSTRLVNLAKVRARIL